jgi:rhodanese-related sulfurtransferase
MPVLHGAEQYVVDLSDGKPVPMMIIDLRALGLPGTHTILLVNDSGTVTDMWTGIITSSEEAALLQRLSSKWNAGDFFKGTLSKDQLNRLLRDTNTALLDIRERRPFELHHIPHSINIPADELQIRARHELDQRRTIVLDCTVVPRVACVASETTLRERGFSQIAFLTNSPYGGLSCSSDLPAEPGSSLHNERDR